jgi:thymidylate synthase (FAD)
MSQALKVSLVNPTEHTSINITDFIAYCARVSNPSNQSNTETSEKLVHYLLKNKHWSPFEMFNVCIEVETTRDIARQVLRHSSLRFQEFSQRYADPVQSLSFVTREARLQDHKNRQNSIETADENLKTEWEERQKNILSIVEDTYKWAIENNIAKEQARAILPEGLTVSRLYINGSIRSWIHFIEVRTHPSTQKEHRELATACAHEIAKVFPMITDFIYNPE